MATKVEMLRTVVNLEKALKDADPAVGLDLGAYTIGWHDEWMWTPEYWKMCGNDPRFTSNTPFHGIGNSSYRTERDFHQHLAAVMTGLAGLDEPFEPDTTDAFAVLKDGNIYIYEFRVVHLDNQKQRELLDAANRG